MRKRNRTAAVAYEAPKRARHRPLRWHRKGKGLEARTRDGSKFEIKPSGRGWALHIDRSPVGQTFDTQRGAKDFANANWTNRFAPGAGEAAPGSGAFRAWRDESSAKYAHDVVRSLEQMGLPHEHAHRLVTDASRYVEGQAGARTPPYVTAAILDATKHHGHAGTCGQHTQIYESAGEGASEMWRVTVTDLRNGQRESRLFNDEGKAAQWADTKQFSNTLVKMGPERGGHRQLSLEEEAFWRKKEKEWRIHWIDTSGKKKHTYVIAPTPTDAINKLEREKRDFDYLDPEYGVPALVKENASLEANDTTCQPFTMLKRDPEKLSACMLRAKGKELRNSRAIYDLVRSDLERRDQETFAVVCLGMRGELRDFVEVSRGQRHRVAVDVEDILRPVIASGCDYFVVMHNHPSGVAEPSDADCELTETIRRSSATACPNIVFADHIIIGLGQFYSFSDSPPKKHGKEWQIGKVTKV